MRAGQVSLKKLKHRGGKKCALIILDTQRKSALFGEEYQDRYPKATEYLKEGLEDSLECFGFDWIDHRRLSLAYVLKKHD